MPIPILPVWLCESTDLHFESLFKVRDRLAGEEGGETREGEGVM